MQVKTTQVGGTGQAATVIDSEALGLQSWKAYIIHGLIHQKQLRM